MFLSKFLNGFIMFLLCLFEQLFQLFLFLIFSFGPDCLFGRAYGFQLLGMALLQCPPMQLLAQVCKQSLTILNIIVSTLGV